MWRSGTLLGELKGDAHYPDHDIVAPDQFSGAVCALHAQKEFGGVGLDTGVA
jgi:hypothetical protein